MGSFVCEVCGNFASWQTRDITTATDEFKQQDMPGSTHNYCWEHKPGDKWRLRAAHTTSWQDLEDAGFSHAVRLGKWLEG
jgi:uncharacterized protein (DUF2237 family)